MHPQEDVIFAINQIIWQTVPTSTAMFVVFGDMEFRNAINPLIGIE